MNTVTSPREIEVAAEHFAVHELDAVRVYRVTKTPFAKQKDVFGADLVAVSRRRGHREISLIQATKASTRMADKRRSLENLGGVSTVEPIDNVRRVVVLWSSRRDPDDGRRVIHEFSVQELERRERCDARGLVYDGRTREPWPAWLWASWPEPVTIDRDTWYKPL